MSTDSQINLDLNLPFPNAGIVFDIKVKSGSNGDSGSFSLSVSKASDGSAVPFRSDASPQLADWVRGYSRWLVRSSVRATYDEKSISGSFFGDPSPEQILDGVKGACDMIRQRFDHYESSVLV